MSVIILAEHNHGHCHPNTLHTITAAQQLAAKVDVLVVGFQCQSVADELRLIEGVNSVLLADSQCYNNQLAEPVAKLLHNHAVHYTYLLAPASTFGKNIMPRVAAMLDVHQVSDITAIKDAQTFVRPIYAGNALETVQCTDEKKVLTIRSTAFALAKQGSQQAACVTIDDVIDWQKTRFIKQTLTKLERPELGVADVVVSGGRGLQNAENFKLLEQLAGKLNAAIGASRAAVDAGFVPNDYQVGQTGKVVAPRLYFAIGISGAIQHIAGMKDSKVIVAINQDEDAAIFNYADYGLVGDLFEIVPELIKALS